MMKDVIRHGTGMRARSLNRDDIAGKTGTTNEHHDAWFNGFNGDLVTTVWTGFDQERTLGELEDGGRVSVPTWTYFMHEALAGAPRHGVPYRGRHRHRAHLAREPACSRVSDNPRRHHGEIHGGQSPKSEVYEGPRWIEPDERGR